MVSQAGKPRGTTASPCFETPRTPVVSNWCAAEDRGAVQLPAPLVGAHGQPRMREVRLLAPVERRVGVEDLQAGEQQQRQAEGVDPVGDPHDHAVATHQHSGQAWTAIGCRHDRLPRAPVLPTIRRVAPPGYVAQRLRLSHCRRYALGANRGVCMRIRLAAPSSPSPSPLAGVAPAFAKPTTTGSYLDRPERARHGAHPATTAAAGWAGGSGRQADLHRHPRPGRHAALAAGDQRL